MAGGRHTLDFTEGVIWKKILRFGLPLLASSLIQLLYNTVDLIFVGQFVSKEASAAVGAGSMLITLLVGLFTGLSVGLSVVASQAFGAHDNDQIKKTVSTALGISVFGGALVMILGVLLGPTILGWMNTPADIMEQASGYIRIYFISIIFVVMYNMCSGCLRAIGNSRFPMIVQICGGVLNVILDYLFIVLGDNGVMGVAYATLICQTLTAIASLIFLLVSLPELKFGPGLFKIVPDTLKKILSIGIPAGIQSMVITLSNVLVQSQINSLGVDVIAAFTAYYKVELLIYLPIMAFGQTTTTFVGQNMGAGNPQRARKGLRVCTLMSMGYAVVMAALLVLVLGRTVFGVFTKDSTVVELGMRVITVTFPFYWIYSILENLSDTIRGAGNSLKPMIIILLNICVLRTALLYLFVGMNPEIRSVAVVYPISWATAALCLALYYKFSKWADKTFRPDIVK